MSHTPGPWVVHPTVAQVDAFHHCKPVPICRLLWPTVMRDEATTMANAKLIASAPDLLAALKECAAQLNLRALASDSQEFYMTDAEGFALRNANAAIACATTGEQS